MKVVVVGGGVAGTAAAWAARRAGAEVVVVHDRAGASALASGAADWDPWEAATGKHALDADAALLAAALGYLTDPCVVCTASGVVRAAHGRDRAVLDLGPLAGRRVAVADITRDDWDAELIARALGASAWARTTETRFVPRAIGFSAAEYGSSWDLAARFDDPGEREALTTELTKAQGEVDAWLLGPWLGTAPGVAEALADRVGLPLGEALSLPGGAAGARFESARDTALAQAGVEARNEKASGVLHGDRQLEVKLEGGDRLVADRVVLALGGLLAGGVRLDEARAGFELSLDAPVMLQVDGQSIDAVSTLHGVDLAAHGGSFLERVGIATEGAAACGEPLVFVAGDVMADRPRTWLRALVSGLAAGRAAGR
ncbi:MAG: FAD-dependent oxidoreductase [Myxococcales bacterium]|nr:FAD-dependent oxidoreductase [Myxococcales bacterium]